MMLLSTVFDGWPNLGLLFKGVTMSLKRAITHRSNVSCG